MSASWKIALPLLAVVLAVASAVSMPGGYSDADINSQPVREALRFAVVQYNLRSNSIYKSEVVNVIKAEQQVVSGMNYKFKVKMGRTDCRKGVQDRKCEVTQDPANAELKTCDFIVWSQPWTNTIKLTHESCQ